ncbi:GMC oxidoreductase [Alcanivorax sp. 1008]|uniref:GMC oxidoreductase n=1 Tax=Alcanivorax sp. 1008 TaxID=2816853 RepID=UPI001DB419D7|nr:GMC family oxidoreductase [Alcanivorax sp. 1008]
MVAEKHDIIVIGSGFGGATTAAKLVSAGAKVTLLERGPWRDTDAIRAANISARAPLPAGKSFFSHALRRVSASWLPGGQINLHGDGLFDLHYDSQLSMICSSGVGGGSHVYSAMNVRPAEDYWDGHHDALSGTTIAAHYDWILEKMGSRTVASSDALVPNSIITDSRRPTWMNVAGVRQPEMGFRFARGRFSNNSFFGSQDNSKVSLDERLLLPLLERGLSVRDRHEVMDICQTDQGFRLTVKDNQHNRIRTLLAGRVVLAAGTLNTLRLLFSSRAHGSLNGMPALGQRIGGNGDVPAYWPCNETGRDYSTGTPCHGRFTLQDNHTDLTRYGLNGVDRIPMPSSLRARLKRDLVLVGMGADQGDGTASWQGSRLKLNYPQRNSSVLADIYTAFDRISSLSGKKVYFLRDRPITVHPFGGARLGQSTADSVINACGEVHDIPGLFIADGSALPAAPGVPPSMTIAAWAGHIAAQLISSSPSTHQEVA